MKYIIHLCLFFSFISIVYTAHSQNILRGSITQIGDEKEFKIEYYYEGMTVGSSKENEFIDKKVVEFNAKKQGKGDEWKRAWKGDRIARFQPAFEESFNKAIGKLGMVADPDAKNTKYKFLVITKNIEPGPKPGANITIEVDIIEPANLGKVLAAILHEKIAGKSSTEDWNTGDRLEEAYANAGKEIGKFIIGKLKE